MPRALLAALLVLFCLLRPATAQDMATLIADRVLTDGQGALVAEGNVEVFYQSYRLTAPRLRYEHAGERLVVEGPITLTDGATVSLLADAAELDADFRNGILLGAQMVLEEQFQLAAPRIDQVDGRYVQLSRAVATSCRVCPGRAPIWEIRANRVIHDTELRRIYFEGAQFRLAGVPVAYLPRFRMPDPTVQRERGFLPPRVVNSTLLGFGLQTPWFLPLGPHADLTLTPWVSDTTTTVVGSVRQNLRFGTLRMDGAVSDDRLTDDLRAYLFGTARFFLPGEFRLNVDVELVSDPAYLSNYDFSAKDRLENTLSVSRTRGTEDIFLGITAFRTLRASELPIRGEVTGQLLEGRYERALPTGPFGGAAWLRFDTTALVRPSNRDIVGRDVTRLGAEARWRDDRVLPAGLVAGVEAGLGTDLYLVADDSTFDPTTFRTTPHATFDLRWPLQRRDGAVTQLLEPALLVAWSRTSGGGVPDEDSTLIDFDEGNLFALSRFPGYDRTEEGLRGSLALAYTRLDPAGWSLGATLGRAFWASDPGIDATSAGLTGVVSDWLVSLQAGHPQGFTLASRTLFEDGGDVSRSETRIGWYRERLSLTSSYTYAQTDPADGRFRPTSEVTLASGYRFDENWSASFDGRYNATEATPVDAALALRYENECVQAGLSLSRNYASSATVTPVTDVTFSVNFGGFGDRRTYRRSC